MAGRREGQAFLPTTANLSLTYVFEQRLDRGSNRGRIQFLHDSHDSVTVQKKQFSKASLRTWAAQSAWSCPAQVGLLSSLTPARTFQRKPKEHISWTAVLSWGIPEALRCLKALYSFWGNSLLRDVAQTPTVLKSSSLTWEIIKWEQHIWLISGTMWPQWEPGCWPLVPAEGTLGTQAVLPSKQEQIPGSVHTVNHSFLLRFRKSLLLAGKLTVPACPGLLLHAWPHSWLCWSLSQWLPSPLCPPTRGPSLKHQQWLLGRKKKNVQVSKESNSSHWRAGVTWSVLWDVAVSLGCALRALWDRAERSSQMKAFTLGCISPNSLHFSNY